MAEQKTLIIGGGISGLIAAQTLQDSGRSVTVLDKGFGIGGRMASRSLKQNDQSRGLWDYGVQFFCASKPAFQKWIEQQIQASIIAEWTHKIQDSTGQFQHFSSPCYRGVHGNRAIAAHLATSLNIQSQTRVTHINWTNQQWQVHTAKNQTFHGEHLLMTPPVPQILEILDESNIQIPEPMRSQLMAIRYTRCIAVLVLLNTPCAIPKPGGLVIRNSLLSWIASNRLKGISPGDEAITLHASPTFSDTHWDQDPKIITQALLNAAQPWLKAMTPVGTQPKIIATHLHRWKYSQPKTVFGQTDAMLQTPGPLVMAGDAFAESISLDQSLSLENAFLSGLSAAQTLLRLSTNETKPSS